MYQWQLEIIRWLQSIGGLESLMDFFSIFGNEEFFLLAIPLIYWCFSSRLGVRLAAILIASVGSNALFKLAFCEPRPYWLTNSGVNALSSETTYGLPSAHAQNAVSIWGYLAHHVRRQSWALAAILIALISISRIYLGMHFMTDILAGWLIGGVFLLVVVRWQSDILEWLAKLNVSQQVILSFTLSIIYLAISQLIRAVTPDTPMEWTNNAATANTNADLITPRSMDLTTTVAGLIFGYGASLAISIRQIQFSTHGSIGQRALRFAVGAVGTVIIWIGLRYMTPHNIPILAILVRYLRYALIMCWVLYIAPRIFIQFGLANGEIISPTKHAFSKAA